MEASRDLKPVDSKLLVQDSYVFQLYKLLERLRYLIEGREERQGKTKLHEAKKGFRSMLGDMREKANPGWATYGLKFSSWALARTHTAEEKWLIAILDAIDPKPKSGTQNQMTLEVQLQIVVQWIDKIKAELFDKVDKFLEELDARPEDLTRTSFNNAVRKRLEYLILKMTEDEKKLTQILQRQSDQLGECNKIYQKFNTNEGGNFKRFADNVEQCQKELLQFIDHANSYTQELIKDWPVLPEAIRQFEVVDKKALGEEIVNENEVVDKKQNADEMTGDQASSSSDISMANFAGVEQALIENNLVLKEVEDYLCVNGAPLDKLRAKYDEVASSYKTLYEQFVPDELSVNKQSRSLSVQIHEKLTNVNLSFKANEDKIIEQLRDYLVRPDVSYSQAKSVVVKLINERGEFEDNVNTELQELNAAVVQQGNGISHLTAKLMELDKTCSDNKLILCLPSNSIMINESLKYAKLLEQFNKENVQVVQERLARLNRLNEQCKAHQLKIKHDQGFLERDSKRNYDGIVNHLERTLLDAKACSLEDSEKYISQQVSILDKVYEQAKMAVQHLEALQERCHNHFNSVAGARNAKRFINEFDVQAEISGFRQGMKNYQEDVKSNQEELNQLVIWDGYKDESVYTGLFNDVFSLSLHEKNIGDSLHAMLQELKLVARRIVNVESLRKCNDFNEGSDIHRQIKMYLDRYCEIEQVIDSLVKLLTDIPKDILQDLRQEVNARSSLSAIRTQSIRDSHKKFLDVYGSLAWGGNVPLTSESHMRSMNAWPAAFEDQLAKFNAFDNALFGVPAKQGDLSISTRLDDVNTVIGEQLRKAKQLQLTVANLIKVAQDYHAAYSRYLQKNHANSDMLKKFNILDVSSKAIIESQLDLIGRLITHKNKMEEIVRLSSQLRDNRGKLLAYQKRFQEDVDYNFKRVSAALTKLNEEVQFKKNVSGMLDSIKVFKDMQKSGFVRLRREFLFCGRSHNVIAKLQVYRETVHAHTTKGNLIELFLKGLFDETRFVSIEEVLAYLENPFKDNRTDQLFKNTGWTNLGGKGASSTTKELIDELRAELVLMQSREELKSVNSVAYALEKDCHQIEGELNSLLQDPALTGVSNSLSLNQEYDALLKAICKKRTSDPVEEKIQQDAVYIQRWFGPRGAGVAVADRIKQRAIHLECVIAIRNQLQDEMSALRAKYPFTYAYHALRCHLEKSTTNRSEQKLKLWTLLDGIVFDNGTEAEKYQRLKQTVMSAYAEVRESFNGSQSYFFFGKGSRWGDALEQFLVAKEETGAGLGCAVSHRRAVKGLDVAAHWLSENVFSCMRAP